MQDVEFIIVGLGIAGATLAWQLEPFGVDVLVIDRGESATASRVAAGLITPVTGMRLVKSWRFDELRAAAWDFHRMVETQIGQQVLHDGPMVRLLSSPQEQDYLRKRLNEPEYSKLLSEGVSLPTSIRSPFGAIELRYGGQLDVPTYLRLTRERLIARQRFVCGHLNWSNVICTPGGVELPEFDLRCQTLVLADGAAARSNPFFPAGQFNATRGEILTVEIPDWAETRVIHGGIWIAPVRAASSPGHYQVGATYDWSNLDAGPTPEGRQQIEERLRTLLDRPFRVVDHVAAVRPILRQPLPIAGRSAEYPQLAFWNGLASKGALQAPLFAQQLASHLVEGISLDSQINWSDRIAIT